MHPPESANTLAAADAADLLAMAPRLRRYARVLAGDAGEADTLVVTTFERWTDGAWPRERSASVRARLFAMLHDAYVNRVARSEREGPPSAAGGATAAAVRGSPPGPMERFARLPSGEREVLLLVAVEGMAYDEIARALDVPVATVVARLGRARNLMRAAEHDEE